MDDFKKPAKKLRLEPSDNFNTPKVNADDHDFSQNTPPIHSNFDIPTVNLDEIPPHKEPKEGKMKKGLKPDWETNRNGRVMRVSASIL